MTYLIAQSEAERAKEKAEARLLELERSARRQHEELDSRAARLEAQLHQQALDTDDYRRRSEAEARRQHQLTAMAEQANRSVILLCLYAQYKSPMPVLHRPLGSVRRLPDVRIHGGSPRLSAVLEAYPLKLSRQE